MNSMGLKHVADFGESAELCISTDDNSLYVVKHESGYARSVFDRLLSVRNPHLASVVRVEEERGGINVIQKYISGETLEDMLSRDGLLSEEKAGKIAVDICDGLATLHKCGIVHRDINPNNIVIENSGAAVIIDFGIAREYTNPKSNDTTILGTPGYAAPEQFGFSQSNEKTDIYAVGILLNVMLTGEFPNVRRAGGSAGRIIGKCIEVDSNKRYKNIDALKKALMANLDDASESGFFLKKIAGFGGKSVFGAVLAAIGYFCEGVISAILLMTSWPEHVIGTVFVILFLFVIPVLVCSDFKFMGVVCPILIISNGKTKTLIRTVITLSSVLTAIILFGWMYSPR